MLLSAAERMRWQDTGCLLLKQLQGLPSAAALGRMAQDVSRLPDAPGSRFPWLVFHEALADSADRGVLARTENFCLYHRGWRDVAQKVVAPVVSQLLEDYAMLFKDKINYKPPGGAGFLAHQDRTAWYAGARGMPLYHVTAMIAVDACTPEKGCLQVATEPWLHGGDNVLPHKNGAILKDAEDKLAFTDVVLDAGDVVLFDSFVPHRAAANTSGEWRRAVFLTYNAAKDGGWCHHKYSRLRAAAAGISANNDFAGTVFPRTRQQQ